MDEIMVLFEGVCPTCAGQVGIVEVAGTPKFLREQTFTGAHTVTTWERGGDEDGMVAFLCEHGHRHEVYHSPVSEWIC